MSAAVSALWGGMKGVPAWGGEMAGNIGVWLLAPGYFVGGQVLC